ncbi:MAG: M20/M25/M40 family metallo-hydrolase, partial [Chloroflexi bacterium]
MRLITMLTTELNWSALTNEAVRHLQELIRCNTTNPPGNEAQAIAYIRQWLTAEGIEAREVSPVPGRPSLWARLPGNGSKRPLLLLSHVDVVPVEREHWTMDPFGGEIRNGYIYGRGAVDMKGMTAKQLTLFLHLARAAHETGQALDRDLLLLAVADEEQHGTHGMAWIAKHAPELIDAEYALNEGGGFALAFGGKRIYVCATAEKGRAEVTLRATGLPGHGAVPHQHNAIARLARAIHRLTLAPLPLHITATMRDFIAAVATTQPQPKRTLVPQLLSPFFSEAALRAMPETTANALRAMLHNTASPTMLQAGQATNVIAGEAVAQLDGRLIPGQTVASFTEELRKRINDPAVTVSVDLIALGHEDRAATSLFE